jgi:hypothetical protein
LFGEAGALDAPGERGLLVGLPLRTEQARGELLVGAAGLFGALGLVVEDLGDLAQVEAFQQLLEIIASLTESVGELRLG